MAVDDVYTKLLLHMDGDNNGTIFTDESGKTVTRVGNACTKTDHCLRDVTKGKTYYASSSYNSSWLPANAFNDNLSTGWHSLNNANNEWIAVDLGTGNACVFDALSFIPRVNENAQVKDFTFYGSNDSTNGADGSWTQIGTGTHTNSATWQLFNFTNSVAYRWAKVVCNTSYHTNFLGGSIIEMEIGTTDKKFGTATAYFDGNGDGLIFSNSSDFEFGSSDFTIEGWFYFLSNSKGYQMLIDKATTGSSGWALYLEDNNQLSFLSSSNGSWDNTELMNAGIPEINTWMHIAIVRYGSVWTMYKNGVAIKSTTYTGNIAPTVMNLGLGNRAAALSYGFQGYMDEVRISKGIARWTENFTPSTEQYYPKVFKSSGTVLFNPISLPTDKSLTSKVSWTHNMPFGTNITILTAISSGIPDEEDYEIVTNGGLTSKFSTSSNQSLYIKGLFETTDVINTPELLSLNCELLEEKNEKIIITLTDADRMKYPIGDVLVAYNKTLGSLTGLQGGQVQSFSIPFTPSLTTRIFNPNDTEKINAALSVISSNMRIYYEYYRSDNTHIQASLGALTQIIAVADIPV